MKDWTSKRRCKRW